MPPPTFQPPIEFDDFVVVDALPGAHVDVFNDIQGQPPEFLGSGDVDPELRAIALRRRLNTPDRLFAIQTLCRSSDRDAPRTEV